ncbi:4-aminobutyrate--2-oxoglutarate transaminase [Cryobacterium sp. TMT1-62]|uniref:(S)-3-amino-2-methylpropionate transaminase n=1 Tax=Cryobacterium sandaracinum TaxID=1259247 RepID=A0ABY2JKQ0_9MICO|nr:MULTISPECIES: 4-aminobutyrate--2-oxoglutarate transaminase [Cryobacterium]TFB57310.1 4-aminobutyrate--2-oxoglutarate transaminase [Cryobacterium sp. Sr3]TFB64648.1 4-aminobutyrate--2-oxoglutarate transaminase [Cryobacterium sp. Hz7]TFC34078.1 4-aminobutyrate--2-oxoglutarate transaminase [Cryobacterium sp. TMT2-14]TFC51349.1 4-aminobutyrate--2-oxoglutarate transaminase [Cryobacterium sp. TMT2-17-1]TFC69597.1 4-aminobutyrate--2-oxoglutarate transaminase [Cryobacterium sp. TMT2-4]
MTDTLTPSTSPSTPAALVYTVPQERKIVTAIPGPRSKELQQRRLAVVSGGVASALPVYIAKANGAILVDVDGNQFIDLGAGIGVTTIGHTETSVVAAAVEQTQDFIHTLFTITPYEEYVRVCELLAEHTPGSWPKKSVLINSGAEAVENGVKIARKHTGRRAVAVLDHAYHGRTVLTMAMNYKAMPYATGYGPLASDVYHAPSSYPYHDGLSGADAAARTIAYLEKVVGPTDLACLVVEPIQGEGGFMVPAEGYFNALQTWCTANGVVMIADEIQSGMARTGKYYASEHFGWTPDLVLTAKGIAGGMPLAAVTGRAEIMDSSQPGGLGGTFGGNPVSCAAAIAVFESIERGDLLAEGVRIENTLRAGLGSLKEKYDIIGEIRGRGAMIAIELVQPGTGDTEKAPNAAAVSSIAAYAAQHGVLLLTAGTYGNVLRFLPSLAVSDALLNDALSVIDDAIAAL